MSREALDDPSVNEAYGKILGLLPEDPFGEGTGEDEQEEDSQAPAGEQEHTEDKPQPQDEDDVELDDELAEKLSDDGEDDDGEREADGDRDDDVEDEEADEESEGDTETEDEVEGDETSSFTVKIDGEEREIPLDELLAGYSRTASWTRKSQALAAERKEFESSRDGIAQERSTLATRLQQAEELIRSQMPPEPKADDPEAWIRYRQELDRLESVQRERVDLHGKMQQEEAARRESYVASEHEKLVDAVPEWSDEKVMGTEKKSLASYAIGTLGFDSEDISQITDHRVVLLLRKAYEYDQLQSKTSDLKSKVRKSKTLKPGSKPASRKSSKATSRKKQARSRRDALRDSGSVKDAAAFIHDTVLDDDEF